MSKKQNLMQLSMESILQKPNSFADPNSMTIADLEHSIEEDRYIDIGISERDRLLVVVYTERGNLIRIISSRRATNREIRIYEQS